MDVIGKCRDEYTNVYKPLCEQLKKDREEIQVLVIPIFGYMTLMQFYHN